MRFLSQVANVRLKLCGLLLPLKRTLCLPADTQVVALFTPWFSTAFTARKRFLGMVDLPTLQALEHLHLVALALQGDTSRDVRAAASAAQPMLSGVIMEGSSAQRTGARVGGRSRFLHVVEGLCLDSSPRRMAGEFGRGAAGRRGCDVR